MSLHAPVVEPLAIATLPWLLPGGDAMPSLPARASRYLLAVSFVNYDADGGVT